jgi:DNA-binding HxlR family transcriptional regulator
MAGTDPMDGERPCPLTAALNVIGGKWNVIVLYWLATGTRRFSDLQRLMPAVTHKVLTASLRQLEHDGLVLRAVYPEVPPRVEYMLSEHGRSVVPVVEAIRLWGHEHLRVTSAGVPVPTPGGLGCAAP